MFLDFYQLKEQPFGVTPDPRYLYLSDSHRETLASLMYGIKAGRGLSVLVAPPGTGKTTLLFRLLQQLRKSARTAFCFQTQCDSTGLLRYLLTDLGVEARGLDFFAMQELLNEVLLSERSMGRPVVWVIDEAQNLDPKVLETARLLSDFETPNEKLLQIVFAGQMQLAETLEKPELAQLRQRIAVMGWLEPLSASDVANYIETRLRVAGYREGHQSRGPFTQAALRRIAQVSDGIPRNINHVCFGAMSLGYALRRQIIDAALIEEAAADLGMYSVRRLTNDSSGAKARGVWQQGIAELATISVKRAERVWSGGVSILRSAGSKTRIGSAPIVAGVAMVVLMMAMLYQQGIRIAAAQTRRTIEAAAANLSRHVPSRADTVRVAATPGRVSAAGNSERNTTATDLKVEALSGTTAGAADNRDSSKAARVQPVSTQIEPASAVTVVVQPGDDLRQLCLRYAGAYNDRIVSAVMKFNAEITDPDQIAAGQRITVPRSISHSDEEVSRNPIPMSSVRRP